MDRLCCLQPTQRLHGGLRRGLERKRTTTPVMAFAVRLHATGCSFSEPTSILAELAIGRSHGSVWNWVHRLANSATDSPSARPTRSTVDETSVKSTKSGIGDTVQQMPRRDRSSMPRCLIAVALRFWLDPPRNTVSPTLTLSPIRSSIESLRSIRIEQSDQLYRPKHGRKVGSPAHEGSRPIP